MFCYKCGSQIKDGNMFCTQCGAKVVIVDLDKKDEVEEPAKAEEPAKVEEPVKAEEPVVTEEPAITEEPVITEEPAITEEPVVTEEPAVTEEVEIIEPIILEPVQVGTDKKVDTWLENDEVEEKEKKGNLILLIGSIVVLLAVLGVAALLIMKFFVGTTEGEDEDTGKKGKGNSYIVHLYSGEGDADAPIMDAEISLYSESISEDNLVAEASYDEKNSQYKVKKIDEGNYIFDIKADGYYDYSTSLEVVNKGEADIYLTPKAQNGAAIFRVDWSGTLDADVCMYDVENDEYVSIGNSVNEYAGCVQSDNSDDKAFEIFTLPSSLIRSNSWMLYVVDSTAAPDDLTTTMEADGVTVTYYSANGEISQYTADPGKNEPIWLVGELTNSGSFLEKNEYYADCLGENSWSQMLKLDQLDRFKMQIADINQSSGILKEFDPAEDNYKPGVRDDLKNWDKTVFYALEERYQSPGYYDKNYCTLKKLQVRSKLTGNIVDYDAYLNPDTGLPNKIVSIEYKNGEIEVMEYYYDNDGKISFIFYYLTDNYVSTYATVGKKGNRFLFDGDILTTWRIVEDENHIMNLCANKAEEARLKTASWKKNSIFRYDKLGEDERQLYDDMELRMINFAYNTYDLICNNEGVGQIVGVVYKNQYVPASNVVVELYDESFENVLYSTTTDANGEYVIGVPHSNYTYNVRVKTGGDDSACDIYQICMDESSFIIYVDSVIFFDDNTNKQTIKLYIGNAFLGHGASIGDAEIHVRSGINNRNGSILEDRRTNADGYVELFLLPGVYTIEASKSGFESIFYTIVSNPYEDNWYEYYTPPTLSEGEYAIVLSWGLYPTDLDSHLFTSDGSGTQHIWYQDKYDGHSSYLDVDDTSSYGPETVTIRRFDASNYYKYCVVDYSNSSRQNYNSTEMSYSNATVAVYSAGGHLATYHVPVNREGVVWEVFEIRNGRLTPIQRYYNGMEDYSWWDH